MIKKIILTLLTSCIFCSALLAQQKMPDVKVELADGTVVSAKDLSKSKPAIISFWSITCKPCIMELNAINDSLEDWQEEADFEVIAVSTDDVRNKATAKSRAKSNGWDFICVFDSNQDLMRAMNVSLTPQSFVVDAQGNIVASHSGYTPGSEEDLFNEVKKLAK